MHEITSERLTEGTPDGSKAVWEIHMAAYRWAVGMVAGKRVVDYGCGSGYGAAYLRDTAEQVIGLDIDPEVVDFANEHYAAEGVSFQTAPVADEWADVVLSFQVIEHVDTDVYLENARRMLKPGGKLLIATPNRTARLYSWQKPWNRWHLTEYDRGEFMEMLADHFHEVTPWYFRASPEIERVEHARYRRMRLILLPATVMPYPVRFHVLNTLAKIAKLAPAGVGSDPSGSISIEAEGPEGLCLAAVATKRWAEREPAAGATPDHSRHA